MTILKESLKKRVCDEGDWIRQADKSHYWSFVQGSECMISGFRRGVNEIFTPFACYAA